MDVDQRINSVKYICFKYAWITQKVTIGIVCIAKPSKMVCTVVWEKFTIGYFCVKIVCGKIFLSFRVSDKNYLTTKYLKVKPFVPLLKNLMHDYT